jgi:hypothetical protein
MLARQVLYHLIHSASLITVSVIGVRQRLIAVLICISLY